MKITPRIELVRIHKSVVSSYPINSLRHSLTSLSKLKTGWFVAEAESALVNLNSAVLKECGDLRITDGLREFKTQAELRDRYIRWVKAGKPDRSSSKYDSKTMKNVFVAEPGFSFHNSGRAIDIHVDMLKFPGVPADKQLDKLWELAVPLGWRPVIKGPWEGKSESWHFDYMGIWSKTYDVLGYKEAAMCASLDIGVGDFLRVRNRALQAQLHRCGMNVGSIDGYLGKKTKKGLEVLGLSDKTADYTTLYKIETATEYKEHF